MKLDQSTQFAFKEAKKDSPEYLGQIWVIVPLSAGVGVVVLVGVLLICWGFQASGRAALVIGGLAMGACALFGFWKIFDDELYMMTETITGHDLNGDGYIGAPPIQEFNYHASERNMQRAQLPAEEHVLREWAVAAPNGGSLAFDAWYRKFGTPPNYKDGVDRYRAFRAAICSADWARENGTHSITLTPKGERALSDWLLESPNGTPLLEA